jgi:hypothetical protein
MIGDTMATPLPKNQIRVKALAELSRQVVTM